MRIYRYFFISMAAFLVMTSEVYSADVAKIGVIDFQQIFDKSDPGKQAKNEITAQGKKMETELKKKAAELEKLQDQLEREAMVMSTEKREQNERDLRIKVNDFRGLQKKYDQDLQRLQKKVVLQLRKDILAMAQEIGKKEGFQLILERSGVLYVPSSLDITDRIIKEYNKKGKPPEGGKENTPSE
jgi:outer membrane protein